MEQNKFSVGSIIAAIVITAIVVGGGVYAWQKSVIMKPLPTSVSVNTADKIKFPIVVYSRAGLLNNTLEGRAEKKKLEEKLVSPYTDYNNEDGINLVALYITVPQSIGEEYSVVGIFGSEKQYGTEEFSFGKREREYEYWQPDCMGPCKYSDAFKARYPQIVK